MLTDSDIKEIKGLLFEVNKKLDVLLEVLDTSAISALAEKSLREFLNGEPGIYSVKDIKAKGSCS
jgi:hypothetical protein